MQISSEKSAMSSLLPALMNKAADHCQTRPLLLSSYYWQRFGSREVDTQQQKEQKKFLFPFQQHNTSNHGDLVCRHRRRVIYISTFVLLSLSMAVFVIQAVLILSGHKPTVTEYNEPSTYVLIITGLVFGTVLYILTHTLMSRTIFYIYYNEQKHLFLGICYNWRMARNDLVFKPGDVQLVGGEPTYMQILRGGYIINKRSYHISSRDFRNTRHYNLMLGLIKSQ